MNGWVKSFALGSVSSLALAAAANAAPAPASNTTVMEELIVTAQRREESIQEVPASITAFGQQSIQKLAISNVEDVTRLTPGLSITRSDGLSGQQNIAIRGVSSFVGAATTAIYIDDTPIQVRFLGAGESAGTAYPSVFDLERIEVLRGPQGTLFGASSEGGTVRFITPRPSLGEWSGHARAEASGVQDGGGGYQLGVAGGGALSQDKVGLRISAYAQRDGGWIDRRPFGGGPGGSDTNWNESQTVNATLLIKLTDELTVTPSVFYQHSKIGSINFFWRNLSDPGGGKYISGNLADQPTKDEFVLPSLKVEWDHGGLSIISNTSYLDHTLRQSRDFTFGIQEILTGDIVGPNAPTTSFTSNPQKQFTQELRAQSTGFGGRLKWVAGVFYQDARQQAIQTAVAPTTADFILALFHVPIQFVLGEGLLPGGVTYSGFDTSHDSQLAGFAQVDFNVTDQLTLTAGVRQSRSKFSFRNAQDGPFNGGPTSGSGKNSEDDTLPKFGLTYSPQEHLRFYASAAKGFRPGGANVPVPSICATDLAKVGRTASPDTFSSDSVWSYEVGSKGEAFDNHLIWDASAYHVAWKGIQSSVYLQQCGFHYIDNLGEAESNGFDFQTRAQLADGLTADLALGYVDAHYDKTVSGSAGPLVTSGEKLNVSPWHVVVGLDYIADREWWLGRPYVHVDDEYASDYNLSNPADALYNPVSSVYRASNTLNGRIGMRRRGLDVSLFAKNLLNEHPIAFTNHTEGSSLFLETVQRPRTVGVTLTTDF